MTLYRNVYCIVTSFYSWMTFLTTRITLPNHFLWLPLPLGGLKIRSNWPHWHVRILSGQANNKQNLSKNRLSDHFSAFNQLSSIRCDVQKISSYCANAKLFKNCIIIKFWSYQFFCYFMAKSQYAYYLFLKLYKFSKLITFQVST